MTTTIKTIEIQGDECWCFPDEPRRVSAVRKWFTDFDAARKWLPILRETTRTNGDLRSVILKHYPESIMRDWAEAIDVHRQYAELLQADIALAQRVIEFLFETGFDTLHEAKQELTHEEIAEAIRPHDVDLLPPTVRARLMLVR